jgi:transposase InsO family protein
MDFVSDALFDGRRFRTLTIVDHFTHECLGIVVDQSLRGEHVAEAMTRLIAERGLPTAIKVDNGSEFAGKVMDRWAYENGVELAFSRRGTPTDNALVESFNGRLGRSASTSTGSCHWPTPGAKSTRGGGASITRNDPTLQLRGRHLQNSSVNTGPKRILRGSRRSNSLPTAGPENGGGSGKSLYEFLVPLYWWRTPACAGTLHRDQ